MPSGALSCERTFPYDALDVILCFACDNSRSRAFQLGTICKYWYDRFIRNGLMWSQIIPGIIIRHGQQPIRISAKWNSYDHAKQAVEAANRLRPIAPSTLAPIEDCSMEYV